MRFSDEAVTPAFLDPTKAQLSIITMSQVRPAPAARSLDESSIDAIVRRYVEQHVKPAEFGAPAQQTWKKTPTVLLAGDPNQTDRPRFKVD